MVTDSNSFFGYYDDNFYGYDFSDEELSDDDVTGMGHDDLDDEVYYGKLNGTIVGLQYYRGTVCIAHANTTSKSHIYPFECWVIF